MTHFDFLRRRKPREYYYLVPQETDLRQVLSAVRAGRGKAKVIDVQGAARHVFEKTFGSGGEMPLCLRVSRISAEEEVGIRRHFPEIRLSPMPIAQGQKNDISVEIASPKDIGRLHEIESASFDEKSRARKEDLKARLKLGTVLKAVIKRGKEKGSIAGFLITSTGTMDPAMLKSRIANIRKPPLFSSSHHLIDLAVDPGYRGRGAAKALMLHALRQAEESKATRAFLHAVNPESFKFFEDLGFVLDEKTFDPSSPTRFYWMPLAAGKDEEEREKWHSKMEEALDRLSEYEQARADDVRQMVSVVKVKHPWIFAKRGKPEKRADAIARILIHEVLYRQRREKGGATQLELPFRRRDLSPEFKKRVSAAAKIANLVRQNLNLPELEARDVTKRFFKGTKFA